MSTLPILQKIHHVIDIDAANDYEKKHTPKIEFTKDGDVLKVRIAMSQYGIVHPHDPDHFFDFFEVYVDEAPVARFHGAPRITTPEFSFELTADASGRTVSTLVSCNLHGLWKAAVTLP